MVCAWMVGGTLSSHLKEYKTTLTLRARYKLVSTSYVYLIPDLNGPFKKASECDRRIILL